MIILVTGRSNRFAVIVYCSTPIAFNTYLGQSYLLWPTEYLVFAIRYSKGQISISRLSNRGLKAEFMSPVFSFIFRLLVDSGARGCAFDRAYYLLSYWISLGSGFVPRPFTDIKSTSIKWGLIRLYISWRPLSSAQISAFHISPLTLSIFGAVNTSDTARGCHRPERWPTTQP